jgi:WD40 repeat protein
MARGWQLKKLEHSGQIISVVFSPNGSKLVVSGPADRMVPVWDTASGRQPEEGHA